MRRRPILSFAASLVVLAAVAVLWWRLRQPDSGAAAPVPVPLITATPRTEPLVGEEILKDYAAPSTTVREDLLLMDQLLTNFRLLVKRPDALPLGSNIEIAQAMRGESRNNKEAFLPPGHRAFNSAGELIDRWGAPLFFHAESHDRIAIRSAGPDRQMWTDDDTVRQADGTYQTGASLGYSGVTPR